MKKLLSLLIFGFIFLTPLKVNALGYSNGVFMVGSQKITTSSYITMPGGNNIWIDAYGLANDWAPNVNRELYVNIKICFDGVFSSSYIHNDSINNTFDLYINNSSARCMFTGSDYTGGRIINIYYRTISYGNLSGHFDSNIIFFPSKNPFSIQLISFNISLEPFDVSNDSDTIINQNEEIIEETKKSNGLLSSIWNGITSVVSGIANLPGLIWNAIKGGFEAIVSGVVALGNFLIDGIKALFIPSGDWFSYWITNLMDILKEQLGFLALPFTLVIDFLSNILTLSASNFIIHIPDINVPIFDIPIIQATTFDFNSILSNTSIHTAWTIYQSFVSVYFIIMFINLCKSKYDYIIEGVRQVHFANTGNML